MENVKTLMQEKGGKIPINILGIRHPSLSLQRESQVLMGGGGGIGMRREGGG